MSVPCKHSDSQGGVRHLVVAAASVAAGDQLMSMHAACHEEQLNTAWRGDTRKPCILQEIIDALTKGCMQHLAKYLRCAPIQGPTPTWRCQQPHRSLDHLNLVYNTRFRTRISCHQAGPAPCIAPTAVRHSCSTPQVCITALDMECTVRRRHVRGKATHRHCSQHSHAQ
jgi:hypothetical protein